VVGFFFIDVWSRFDYVGDNLFFLICTSAAAMIKPSVSGGSVTVTAMVQGGGAVVGMVKKGTRGGGGREKAICLEMEVDAYLCCVLLDTSSRVPHHHRQRRRCSRTPAARSQSRATWQERSVFGKRDVLVWPSRIRALILSTGPALATGAGTLHAVSCSCCVLCCSSRGASTGLETM
jgi:hypothetical protein